MRKVAALICGIAAFLVGVAASASNGFFNIQAGEAYAIGGYPVLSGGVDGTTPILGTDGTGSIELRAASGETISGWLGGQWQFFAESQPSYQLFVAAGDVQAAGYQVRVLPLSGSTTLNNSVGLIVFDTSAADVEAVLPPAVEFAGREFTFAKVTAGNVGRISAAPGDRINNLPFVELTAEWSSLRVHSVDSHRWLVTARSP